MEKKIIYQNENSELEKDIAKIVELDTGLENLSVYYDGYDNIPIKMIIEAAEYCLDCLSEWTNNFTEDLGHYDLKDAKKQRRLLNAFIIKYKEK